VTGGVKGERETTMNLRNDTLHVCVICRFPAELDDAVVPTDGGRCICLRCFARETETARPMDCKLREAIIAVLAEAQVVPSA
jgi:hypothetical protein